MLVFETLKNKKSHFLNSNTCQCSQLYGTLNIYGEYLRMKTIFLDCSQLILSQTLLKAKSITKVGAGDGFSVFASDNGILMTCGDGTLGCLGKEPSINGISRAVARLGQQHVSVSRSPPKVIRLNSSMVWLVASSTHILSKLRDLHNLIPKSSTFPARMQDPQEF